FFPELVQIQIYLEDLSLYKKYYNQLVISDFLQQVLLDVNYSQFYKNKQNKVHYLNFEDELVEKHTRTEHEKNTCEIGIQTDEISMQVNKKTRDIGIQVFDNTLYTFESYHLQVQLNIKLNEIEDLKKRLEYAYNYVVE
ncbi:11351_t:CDS:1, partial [Racocetra fulgida]